MPRKVFFSFHFKPDNWRAAQVRNMGVVEGNSPASDNDWESITQEGDLAIKRWIAEQMSGKSCTVVLIGSATANRKWINYEINKSWNDEKGVLGIYIHRLKDANSQQSAKGGNPFDYVRVGDNQEPLSRIAKTYDPPYYSSEDVYSYIKEHLADWIEEAIRIRAAY